MIRTRIAPSPTGKLHIGTARTALFNYLYAKNQGGTYVLRIEDTDKNRSTKESEHDILAGLEWLGIGADEGVTTEGELGDLGPYRQSDRTGTYRQYLEVLIESGDAYWCPTSGEELDRLKKEADASKQPFIYRPEHRDGRYEYQEGSVLRFKVPDEVIWFEDKIKGKIEFDTSLMGDFVIAKGWDNPLYNFVVVIDDELMQITHIIRGEDHISNTPKQILINRALGFKRKNFGHMPLILAPDKSKMSKRHGATSVEDYRALGYLPEAMVNFLALLGWNEGNDREDYTLEELVQKFSLKRVQKSGAVFNKEKLDSINAKYIRALPIAEKVRIGSEFLTHNGFDLDKLSQSQLEQIISIECDRIKTFGEIGDDVKFFFETPEYDGEILVWKNMTAEEAKASLEWVKEQVYNIDEDSYTEIESRLKEIINESDWGMGQVLWPLRVALSGQERSPSPFEIMQVLGKDETLARIDQAIQKLS